MYHSRCSGTGFGEGSSKILPGRLMVGQWTLDGKGSNPEKPNKIKGVDEKH